MGEIKICKGRNGLEQTELSQTFVWVCFQLRTYLTFLKKLILIFFFWGLLSLKLHSLFQCFGVWDIIFMILIFGHLTAFLVLPFPVIFLLQQFLDS